MRMEHRSDPSGRPFQDMLNTAYGGFALGGRTFEPWFKAAARGNLEILTLMSRRAQAYLELPTRLCQCRTPQDVAAEQLRFWQTMAQQYTESSQRVLGAWSSLAQQTVRGTRTGAEPERDYITFPEPEEAKPERGGPAERRAA